MSDVRLLVFGATGYTGRYVVKDACARGLSVVAHIRPGSPRTATVGETLTACGARLASVAWEADAIRALVEEVQPTHVFALLGITKAGARREATRTGQQPTYAQVDTGFTNMVLDAVEAASPSARVVYLSSLGADKPSSSAYLKARHVVETRLMGSTMEFTIARPSFISGDDRDENRLGERMGSAVSDAVLAAVGLFGGRTLQRRFATVTGAELGRMLVSAATDPSFARRAVDMVDLRAL
jgi:uncharacterized protein YbjT (DUF2867 family)